MNQTSYESGKSEIDKPFECDASTSVVLATKTINSKDADDLERELKYRNGMDKHLYKKYGLFLLIGCIAAYFLLVIFDMIVTNACQWSTSPLETNFVELLKFIISTLIGFVFSESIKHKNE